MKPGISTIQQTLTVEAARVLSQSVAEAARCNHAQTTPLHVAAAMLASPSGFLRQACIKSHPNSSHPLQCRALELCFSVALERLPTSQNAVGPGVEPPISNALMAALKRAQAHQRRGCPEQQQPPLLAVKVEIEQLMISILDDPSVSRVMKEASFSSPAVKATIEQSLNSSSNSVASSTAVGLHFLSPASMLRPPFSDSSRTPAAPATKSNVELPVRSSTSMNFSSISAPNLPTNSLMDSAVSSSTTGILPFLRSRETPDAVSQTTTATTTTTTTNRNMYLNARLQQVNAGAKAMPAVASNTFLNPKLQQANSVQSEVASEMVLRTGKSTCLNPRLQQGNAQSPLPTSGRNTYVNPRLIKGKVATSEPTLSPSHTMNPRLYQNPKFENWNAGQSGQPSNDEIKRAVDVLLKNRKRNPVLVGDSQAEIVAKEILRRVESKEIGDEPLHNVRVLHLEKFDLLNDTLTQAKMVDSISLVDAQMMDLNCGGVVLDLGNLKWLVEPPVSLIGPASGAGSGQFPKRQQQQQQQQLVSEAGQAVVAEFTKLLGRFAGGRHGRENGGKVWLIGTATCETYLRFQIYHPSIEADWDLQTVPIASRAPVSRIFHRLDANGSSESSTSTPLKPKGISVLAATADHIKSCCPICVRSYEQEMAKVMLILEKSCSQQVNPESSQQSSLPQWLRNAKSQDLEMNDQVKTKSVELQKKWYDACTRLHPHHHHHQRGVGQTAMKAAGCEYSRAFIPTITNTGNAMASSMPEEDVHPQGSPIRTDLVLGRLKPIQSNSNKIHEECSQDPLGCLPSEPPIKLHDADSFKKLIKGLMEEVWWQQEAASAVAATVLQCKFGNGKRRGSGTRGDIWLLFTGPDAVGKKKMASALSLRLCGANPICFHLGSRREENELNFSSRGKTVLDRVVEAVRRNPVSVITIDAIDEADMLARASIKRAMERGRLSDSYGREISLGNVIFILTASWLVDEHAGSVSNCKTHDEKSLSRLTSRGCQLKLRLCEKTAKRRANWILNDDRPTSQARTSLSFDLNAAADSEENKPGGCSRNSSDLTIDNEDEYHSSTWNRLLTPATSAAYHELLNYVDDKISFRPIDFGAIRCDVSNAINKKFSAVIGTVIPININEDALGKVVGGALLGRPGLEEWTEKVMVPCLQQLKLRLPLSGTESLVVQLESDDNPVVGHIAGDRLPSNIQLVVDPL